MPGKAKYEFDGRGLGNASKEKMGYQGQEEKAVCIARREKSRVKGSGGSWGKL